MVTRDELLAKGYSNQQIFAAQRKKQLEKNAAKRNLPSGTQSYDNTSANGTTYSLDMSGNTETASTNNPTTTTGGTSFDSSGGVVDTNGVITAPGTNTEITVPGFKSGGTSATTPPIGSASGTTGSTSTTGTTGATTGVSSTTSSNATVNNGTTTGNTITNTSPTITSGTTGATTGITSTSSPTDIANAGANVETGAISEEEKIKQENIRIANEKQAINVDVANSTIATETAYADAKIKEAEAQAKELANIEAAKQAELARQKQVAIDEEKPLLQSQIDLAKAAKDKADSDAQLAIENAKIEAENAYINASVNWGKAGGGMNAGFIAAIQNLAQTNTRNIANMKVNATYKSVEMQTNIAKAEFDMVHKINGIINTSNMAAISSRKTFLDEVATIKGTILLTKKEKETKINSAKMDYINNKTTIQDKLTTDMRKANDEIQDNLKKTSDLIKVGQDEGQKKVDSLIMDGQWETLSPTEKAKYAQNAGKSLEQIVSSKNATVYNAVNKGIQAYFGEGIAISPSSQQKVFQYAQSLIATGMSPSQAVLQSILANSKTLPEYVEYENNKKLIERGKVADIESKEASAESNLIQARVARETASSKIASDISKYNKDAAAKNEYAFSKNDDGTILVTNKDTGDSYVREPIKDFTKEQWAKKTGVEALDAPEGEVYGYSRTGAGKLQCGEYANNVTGSTGIGETAEQRKAGFTDTTPNVGGQVFFSGNGYDQKYGHVAIVTQVNADGSYVVKEANRKGDGVVQTRTIQPGEATGFYNNTNLAKQANDAGITDDVFKLRSTTPSKNTLLAEIPANSPMDKNEKDAAVKSAIEKGGNVKQNLLENLASKGFINPLTSWTEKSMVDWTSSDRSNRVDNIMNKGAEFAKAVMNKGMTADEAVNSLKLLYKPEDEFSVKVKKDSKGNPISIVVTDEDGWNDNYTISLK